MKIKKLHIYNIASIIDETIDFTQHPLSDSDVFLITGNMGSGKSTILDAICLALYNTTPRLDGLSRDRVNTSNLDDIPLRDPRRLMRHETGEASVTLWFEGIGGVDYEAEWHVQRGKKKNASSQLSNVDWSLKNLATDEFVSASKSPGYNDVKDEIAKAVGLDYTQFCRTTMLAQGEFTAFLKSDEDKKGEILSKLTHFDEYTEAGMLIFQTTQEKKKAWEAAKAEASDMGLSDNELAEKNKDLETLENQAKDKKDEADNALKKKNWTEDESRLASAKTLAEQNKQNAHELIESEDYKSKELTVTQWNETTSARKWYIDKQDAEQNVETYNNQIKDLKTTFCKVLAGQAYNKATDEATANDIKTTKLQLELNADKETVFEKEEVVILHLETIADANKAIEGKEKNLAENRKKHEEELIPAENTAKEELAEATEALNKLDSLIAEKEQNVTDLNLSALYAQRTELNSCLNNLESAKAAVDDVARKKADKEKKEGELKSTETQILNNEKLLKEEVGPRMKKAEQEKETREKELSAMHDTVDKFAVNLRSRLTIGCTCPVCRQAVNTLPVESELNELFNAAEEKFNEAKKSFEDSQKEHNSLYAKINADTESYKRQKSDFDNDTSVSDAKEKAKEACCKVGINNINGDVLNDIENLRKETQNTLDNELKDKIELGENLNKELEGLRKKRSAQDDDVKRLGKVHEAAKNAVIDSDNEKSGIDIFIKAKLNEITNSRTAIAGILGNTQWKCDWDRDAQGFTDELKELASKHRNLKGTLQMLENKHQLAEQSLKNVDDVINDIGEIMPEWKAIASANPIEVLDIEKEANNLKTNITTASRMLENESEKMVANSKKLQEYLDSHAGIAVERLVELGKYSSEDIASLQRANEKLRNEAGNADTLLEKAGKDYSDHLAKKPVITEADTLEQLTRIIQEANEEYEKLNQQIGVLKEELRKDKAKKEKLGDLQSRANKAREEYEKWNRLNRHLGSSDGKVFRNIAQSYILDGLLKSANTYLQKLNPRYALKAVPATLHISLEDAYQGYSTRGTDSLSGGESFLVSLALALALADVGQALAVDTLFIDEGFGTLSGQPLTNAINTLRSLHGQSGRHVGIISHIQEVRENIPVQIRVKQSGGSSSSTIEVCEVQ